jgi:uncharacterized protein
MQQRGRLIFLALCLATLIVIGRATTGSLSFLFGDFWFTSGLLLLILLSIVDQPHFSKNANVFVNGVAGLISLLPIPKADRSFLWWVFLSWSAYLAVSSYSIMLLRSKELEHEGPVLKVFSRMNREIGRPEALFSAYFLWGVSTQFSQSASAYRALFLFWAVFMILNLRQVSEHLASILAVKKSKVLPMVGTLRAFSSPRTVECTVPASAPVLQPGSMARIRVPSGRIAAQGQVVDDRVLDGVRIVRVGVTSLQDGWGEIADATNAGVPRRVEIEPLEEASAMTPAGVVDPGSTIGSLRVLVNPDTDLVDGEVLGVDLLNTRAYYQVVAATLREERVHGNQCIQSVEVTASQLGVWRPDPCRFEPVAWVAPAGGLVLRLSRQPDIPTAIPEGHLKVGDVPNSFFPVHLDLDDLVTHNTAILGVTGSGKSYLSFWIICGLVKRGVKVLVLDISRQHYVFLKSLSPTPIKTLDEVETWFKSESLVGIHQFASSTNYPLTTADLVERLFKQLEKLIKLKPGENEPARVCIVFEEAHSLIPEWNQVAQRGDEAHVNRTARTVLQGRKYGLGCLVISQRTANVTKTILNQCNTIAALQSFDQTGLDFLSNYMGTAYANAISTLPPRHAVLVGKASSSTRPILFRIADLEREWTPDEKEAGGVDTNAVQAVAAPEVATAEPEPKG